MAKRLDDLPPKKRWTVEEFLDFDDGSDTRYELLRGELVAMAPPSRVHGRLVTRLSVQLASKLQSPCEVTSEVGIRPVDSDRSYFQADLAVACTPGFPEGYWESAPVLIVEIRSPSTERKDLYDKLLGYQSIASVRDILVVDSRAAHVDHFVRDGTSWRQTTHVGTGMIELVGLAVTIDLARLYEGLLAPTGEG